MLLFVCVKRPNVGSEMKSYLIFIIQYLFLYVPFVLIRKAGRRRRN